MCKMKGSERMLDGGWELWAMGDVRVTSKNISQIHNGSQCRRFFASNGKSRFLQFLAFIEISVGELCYLIFILN